jgi:phosphomevalonate kinase
VTASVTASAPGKVVLYGEYAVLEGAPAIAMAVNRRARVTLTHIAGNEIRVRAPGYSKVDGLLTLNAKHPEWRRGESDLPLVAAVVRELEAELQGGMRLELNTDGFADLTTGRKVGIGSSAALTVSLCAALSNSCNVIAAARRAHSALQAGLGSGIDIACAGHGGLLEYRVADYQIESLQWPVGLFFQIIWTGVVVSTPAKLQRLTTSGLKTSNRGLTMMSGEMASLWRGGQATDILAAHEEYVNCLQSFSSDHELGIFDGGHRELADAAAESGLAYKPCGAGGGDVGMVLGIDAAALVAFVREQSHRCVPLDCDIDHRGVTLSSGPTKNE